MVDSDYLRRQPQQARGQQRVNAILNAAEKVFAEVGYRAATTNAIAARAHTNIASLYQFFPNKEAILAGVVARYRDEYAALAVETFRDDWQRIPLPALIDRLIDAVLDLHTRHGVPHPFFVSVGGGGNREFAGVEQEVYAGLMTHGERALTLHAPQLDAAQRRLALQIVLRISQALVHLADTTDADQRAQVIEALKLMLHAFLDALQPHPPSAPPKAGNF